ncbi:heavy metal translocating P-type ATPase [Arthrobacter stackebrandtii]|uniref:Heavy metal translocating P-type ATPase n=1 Tax=Arthrobacter stackebrandtii TaxID=272161 RepID=A0ABS4YXA6_9MICC|nr:heavy metal translocating P-type ATPase [Arthrobacter stackebrandtii]MBP2413403.1 heavy metal translocating P-type ATPase [Arthrobacter stackebrandtii]PYH00744.1 cadmium-translocating P-type ATPase [Arthrobacter stackebrandtii]
MDDSVNQPPLDLVSRHDVAPVNEPGKAGKLAGFIRRYPVVALTLVVMAVAGGLALSGLDTAAQWVASVYAVGIAVQQGIGMVRDIMRGHWGIDILAVTAIVATVVVGEYIASLIIVLMLSGGEALEDYAAGRAQRELKALLDRAPLTAHREGADGATEEVSVAEVRVGDILVIKPAEVVPVDGLLRSESASFDEAAITGESLPVDRVAGEPVISGTVNGSAAVRMEVTATEADSQYSRIVALVQAAADSKAPVVRLADRYAVPFTIVALALAGLAWFLSKDPARFAEVLVVATPCPLLIAAPVAFLGGMSRAAKAGIIIKSGGTLEQLARVRSAAFDKTGTLTGGHPTLEEVRPASGFGAGELLSLAASAEQYSSHVLASAVIDSALSRGLELHPSDDAVEHATNGVAATCNGRAVIVGKPAFIAENASGLAAAELASGQLAVYVAVDGRFAGTLIMRDPIRPNSAATIASLHAMGVGHAIMLTGDAQSTAEHIAREAGIDQVRAGLLPEDKVRIVTTLEHRPVLMVGDGINDAPVLAAADVGIAMGAKGSTAASESADVVIMLDDLAKVAQSVEIGRRTMKIAVQSIWIGIILSVGLMVLAAFGCIPAVAGALSQELVDLATILNALRALLPGRRRRP